jgi:hypothetical protein
MAKTDQKSSSFATHRDAGMNAEDAAYIKNIRIQQEKQHDSFKFSSESDSSPPDDATSLPKGVSHLSGGPL